MNPALKALGTGIMVGAAVGLTVASGGAGLLAATAWAVVAGSLAAGAVCAADMRKSDTDFSEFMDGAVPSGLSVDLGQDFRYQNPALQTSRDILALNRAPALAG